MMFFKSEDLKVGYSKKIIVDNVNFELKKGQILCILGPNGCGKSTILKSITDHLELIDGSISILGKDLNGMKSMEKAKEMSV
ncbi:MAG: ATP-binding cassette domain-containing protein, partial [Tissierella sp.]|uniref:ATP-binding cassette domain-containing protein n=1 Tax=Tissierella sp. TaxID=41274 RepID=UPI003F9B65FA